MGSENNLLLRHLSKFTTPTHMGFKNFQIELSTFLWFFYPFPYLEHCPNFFLFFRDGSPYHLQFVLPFYGDKNHKKQWISYNNHMCTFNIEPFLKNIRGLRYMQNVNEVENSISMYLHIFSKLKPPKALLLLDSNWLSIDSFWKM